MSHAGNEITDREIGELMTAAGQAGDLDMVAICHVARGDREESTQSEIATARARCAEVIADAAGMADTKRSGR